MAPNYQKTKIACYLGIITQAISANFVPLLFLTFAKQFSFSLDRITLITTVNFAVQLTVDRALSETGEKYVAKLESNLKKYARF